MNARHNAKRPVLSRRTFLRGTGTALALPFLDAMITRRALAAPAGPKRFLCWYVPNGMLLLPPSAFFIIGLLIWGFRSWKPAQVEAREFKIQTVEEH